MSEDSDKLSKSKYQSREFLALRKQWYKKLAKAGFEDIERTNWTNGEGGSLLHGVQERNLQQNYCPLTVEYYRRAEQLLSLLEEWQAPAWVIQTWELHSRGNGLRRITSVLRVSWNRARWVIGTIGAMAKGETPWEKPIKWPKRPRTRVPRKLKPSRCRKPLL